MTLERRKAAGEAWETVEVENGGSQPVLPDDDQAETQPSSGTLKTWATTDAINGTLVHFRSKGVYASLADDQGFLAFVARTIGAVGNTFTVAYTAPELDEPLLVSVDGNAITVELATNSVVQPATLETNLGVADADLTYTAQNDGTAGNNITVAYVKPSPPEFDAAAEAAAAGDDITVTLGTDAAPLPGMSGGARICGSNKLLYVDAHAELETAGVFTIYSRLRLRSNPPVIGLIFGNVAPGYFGLGLKVDSTGHLVVRVTESGTPVEKTSTGTTPLNTWTDVAVTLDGTNAKFYIGGALDSTVACTAVADGPVGGDYWAIGNTSGLDFPIPADVEAIAYYPAAALSAGQLTALIGGTPPAGAGLVFQNFTGDDPEPDTSGNGFDAEPGVPNGAPPFTDVTTITSTADDVKDAIEADVDSGALVAVAHAPGNDGSGIVTIYGPTNLAGGSDGGITSTASEVKAAIEAKAEAAALVNVILQDDGVMEEMSETALSGGDDTTVLEGSVSLA